MEKTQYWDDIYNGKIKSNNFLQLNEKQISKILECFPYAESALDIGCGRGELLALLKNKGLAVTGIDLSSVAVEQAKKIPGAILYLGNFEDFSFPKNVKFDLVFVKFVLAYIDKKETFFSQISNLLNPQGGLVVVSPIIEEEDSNKKIEEIFVNQKILDQLIFRYFDFIKEDILYKETKKKLSFYIFRKK